MTGRTGTTGNRPVWRRPTAPVVLTTAAAMLLSACGGNDLRGEPEFASGAIPGINQRVDDVLLRDVVIQQPTGAGEEIPVGGTARLTLVLLNDGVRADALVGVTSPVAGSTALLADRDDDNVFELVDEVKIPADAEPPVGAEGFPYYIELRDLNTGVRVGETQTVTFDFAEADDIELSVPVAIPGRATGSPIGE